MIEHEIYVDTANGKKFKTLLDATRLSPINSHEDALALAVLIKKVRPEDVVNVVDITPEGAK